MSSQSLQNPDEIYPIPDVPPSIRDAVTNEKLVVFIGAGASRIIGCPGWKELADFFVEKSFEKELVNHWEKEKLKTNDSRKIISISKEVLGDAEYEGVMNESLQKRKDDLLKKFPIYDRLIRLRGIYITTNIDTHFDSFFEPQRIFIKPSQFKGKLYQNTLYKLHGSLTDIKKVIFTTQDYISHYNNTDIKKFLEHIFSGETGYTILFIGYSLAELEILDYILLKGEVKKRQDKGQKEAKYFVLLPFYGTEKGLLRFERSYFNTLDVVTVPYAIDDKGHDQLYFVIEAWEKEINISTPYLYKNYEFIEKNVSDFVESNASEIFQLIRNDDHNRVHFFKKLRTIEWFTPLKEKDYFSSKNAPDAVPSGQEGYYSFPEWIVLPYLECVSQQVSIPGNERYIDGLLEIIKDVSGFRDARGQHLDNYRTWYYFTKILLNLPNEKITGEIIDLIPIWLSKSRASILGAEITRELLPKFLISNGPNDLAKAEKLVEIITRIEWVSLPEKSGECHGRDADAKIIIEPYWLEDFEKNFERMGTVCSIRIIETIAKRILEIFSKEYSSSYDLKYKDKKYRLTHTLESGKHQISVYPLESSDDSFSASVYPPLESLYDSFSAKVGKSVKTFSVENYTDKNDFVTKVKNHTQEIFVLECAELDKAIASIYLLRDNTYIGYSSLDDSLQNITIGDSKKILIYMLTKILSIKAGPDKEETGKLLEKFLSQEYPFPLFKRLVLYIVRSNYDSYKNYFFKFLERDESRCFEEPDYEGELATLLEYNFDKFSPDEKQAMKKIIEAGTQYLSSEEPEKDQARWRQRWLSLMTSDPSFAVFFEEQKKITGIEKDKFRFGKGIFMSSSPVSIGFGDSPLTVEEILNLPVMELARKLKEFSSENTWEGKTVEGFADSLREAVIANPERFTENLTLFKDIGFIYVCKIIVGFKDAWKAKKIIDWGRALDFIASYADRDQFWRDGLVVEEGNRLRVADHKWVVGAIVELIEEGSRDNSWAFSKEHFDKAKEIVFTLLREPDGDKEIEGYLFHALNSACGKSIFALMHLALHIARSEKKEGIEKDPKWPKEFKDKFDELLETDKVGTAHVCFGRFLPYLYWLDREWVEGRITQAVSKGGTKHWQALMEGYLSGGKVFYELMKPHYEYAVSFEFKQKHDSEYLIQHICIGYLLGHEKIEAPDSLFRKIIDDWNLERIQEVISFFWEKGGRQRDDNARKKILEFWGWLYDKYKSKEEGSFTEVDKRILSAISRLAVFLPEINDEFFKWLEMVVPYVDLGFNYPNFIECLDMLKDKGDKRKTAERIGKLYLKMLGSFTPDSDFNQKHIKATVVFLYEAGELDNANKICNIYGTRGQEFLRTIYDEKNRGA